MLTHNFKHTVKTQTAALLTKQTEKKHFPECLCRSDVMSVVSDSVLSVTIHDGGCYKWQQMSTVWPHSAVCKGKVGVMVISGAHIAELSNVFTC